MPGASVSRVQFAVSEIDHVLGAGFAQANPALVAAVMVSASMDYAAQLIAAVLAEPEPIVPMMRRSMIRS
jgi:hypothetical protein